jgi:hypothetical protein
MPNREAKEDGCEHRYTCWPADNAFDETDPTAVIKWVKKVERSEGYALAIAAVCARLETILKSNGVH